MKKNKKPTINDIAKLTGLSPATISRALRNKGYVSSKSRLLIAQAQQKLNYHPKSHISVSNLDKSNLIMLCLPDTENTFWFHLIKGVQSVCLENNYFPLLAFYDESPAGEEKILNSARKLPIDGLIFVTLDVSPRLCVEIQQLYTAKVVCSFYTLDIGTDLFFDYISVDSKKGIYMAANHLIQQGYDTIGYLGLSKNTMTGIERYKGYETAMKNAHKPINSFWIQLGDDSVSEKTGYEAIHTFYKANKMPSCVCTANDRFAIGAYQACRELNISIPDQFGIIGLDDLDITYKLSPSISSVDISPYDLGRNSANLLFERIKKSNSLYQNITLEPKLVIKESTMHIAANKYII